MSSCLAPMDIKRQLPFAGMLKLGREHRADPLQSLHFTDEEPEPLILACPESPDPPGNLGSNCVGMAGGWGCSG